MSYLPKKKSADKIIKGIVPRKDLIPRFYNGIQYVLSQDIIDSYGKKWYKKWSEAYGIGHTGMMIPPNDPSHGKREPQFGIYLWDFLKAKNIIENGPTDIDIDI